MIDNERLLNDDDEHESNDQHSRLYIDENCFPSWDNQQQTKSTNTGNPFELDFFFVSSLNRFQTRASQTILTSDTRRLRRRHRATLCQAEYFATSTQGTNTTNGDTSEKNEEKRIEVRKRSRMQTDCESELRQN